MRKIVSLFVSLLLLCSCNKKVGVDIQTDALAIVGASFAYPENGWFELACEQLGYVPINKAISGENIKHTALKFKHMAQFTKAECDRFGTLVIMHTHDFDVYGGDEFVAVEELSDNPTPAEAYDYVIRSYIAMCQALEFDALSVWYGIKGGKPIDIILCTHWHDARVVFNDSVRRLAARWAGYVRLCEFDTQIGFTKENLDPESGKQVSVLYAHPDANATEIIDGVEYGWHPKRGRDSEIQQTMAQIFCDSYF